MRAEGWKGLGDNKASWRKHILSAAAAIALPWTALVSSCGENSRTTPKSSEKAPFIALLQELEEPAGAFQIVARREMELKATEPDLQLPNVVTVQRSDAEQAYKFRVIIGLAVTRASLTDNDALLIEIDSKGLAESVAKERLIRAASKYQTATTGIEQRIR